jgi:integrase
MFTGRNPAALATVPEMIPVRAKQALTPAMVKKLLRVLPEPTHGLALTTALTSMNIAEVCGLRWKYVNPSKEWETVDGEGLPPFTIAVRWQ